MELGLLFIHGLVEFLPDYTPRNYYANTPIPDFLLWMGELSLRDNNLNIPTGVAVLLL